MSHDFETQLKDRLAAAAADVAGSDELYDRAEQRHRAHTRTRVAAGGFGALAVVALAAVGALWANGTLDDRPASPVVQQPEPSTPTPSPEPTPNGSTHDDWAALPSLPEELETLSIGDAVWTGGQVLAIASRGNQGGQHHELVAYDPATSSWSVLGPVPLDGAPVGHVVWTGRELLVVARAFGWEDENVASMLLTSYDPDADAWSTSEASLDGRSGFSATWTGHELVVWGGYRISVSADDEAGERVTTYADGGAYDPATGTWRTLAPSPLSPRGDHGAIWNGRRLVVFGGGHTDRFESEFFWDERFDRHDAAAYDPATDTWATIQSPGEIGPLVASAWTGEHIVYWTGHLGPEVPGNWREPGRVWDPVIGDSSPLPAPPFDQRRDAISSTWVDELGAWLVWGGSCGEGCNRGFAEGAMFDPRTGSWTSLAGPEGIVGYGSIGVWGDDRLFAVGGSADHLGAQPEVVTGAWWRPSD